MAIAPSGLAEQFFAEAEKLDPEGFANARAKRAALDADRKDAERYRKYRAMVIAGLAEPVTTDEFDATMDSAVVPVELLARPDLWGAGMDQTKR